ncbi:MAG: S8 family peptidase [Acidobacteriota bacterium]
MLNCRQIFILTAVVSACQAVSAQTLFAPSYGEYLSSTTVRQLGMRNIHARGILGQGVVVALLDTGLNLNNPEFANNRRVMTGYNATNGSSDITDTDGHGTHVAGIVGAPGNSWGMYGVAPGATLLPIKVFSGGTAPASVVTAGLDYAMSQSARVINLSLGANSPTGDTGLRRVAAANSAVVVIAAGNNALARPNWPSRYAKESWANGTLISVGAVDLNRKIASFSNRAGDIAQWYIVAPGVDILSSYGTGQGYMTGTSMASPAVAGAAALVTGYWPYLRANQVAAILLNTADDLGAPGVDAVYGHGMLNVNRAMSPVGSYNYKTITGAGTRISLGAAGVTSTQPAVSTPSAFGKVQTEVFDDYGRNFHSQEGAALSSRSVMTVDTILGRIDRLLDASEKVLMDGGTLMRLNALTAPSLSVAAVRNANESGDAWNHTPAATNSFVAYRSATGYAFSAGDGGLSTMSLGLMGSTWARHLGGLDGVLNNPLSNFAPQHRFATLGAPLVGGWQARVATLQSKRYNAASGNVSLMELTHIGERHALNVSTGDLAEQGVLGGYSNAAMGLNQATHTQGLTVSGAYLLAPQWALGAAHTCWRPNGPLPPRGARPRPLPCRPPACWWMPPRSGPAPTAWA